MIETQTDKPKNGTVDSAELERLREEVARLNRQNIQLRNEIARLRGEKHDLHRTLDAYVSRASSPSVFGPLELTAGTCVGPRRRCTARHVERGA
ncbi:MAG: hypothetical protein ACTHQQ_19090 [Solirubrobacteraceae bacterium]